MEEERSLVPLVLVLILFALVGAGANLLVIWNPPWLTSWFGSLFEPMETDGKDRASELPDAAEGVRESVYLIYLNRCDGQGQTSGTGFLIADGFAVTCAHVIGDHLSCGSEIRVIDSESADQVAYLEAESTGDDLALLRLNDTEPAPLPLTDSEQYEDRDDVVEVFTVGYPLIGAASTPDRASFSGTGSISQYDSSRGVFITSGLNINPGNSGGPVILEDGGEVLGVACSKLDSTVGEGIGYVIPSDTVRRFFSEKTGQEIP